MSVLEIIIQPDFEQPSSPRRGTRPRESTSARARVVVEYTPSGARPSETIQTVMSLPVDEARRRDRRFQEMEFGQYLGEALFGKEVRNFWNKVLGLTQEEDRLHVRLWIDNQELGTLRWERLCAPFEGNRWKLLARSQKTPFAVHIPTESSKDFPPLRRNSHRPLKALILAASPDRLEDYAREPFDAGRDACNVCAVLMAEGINCTVLANVTPDQVPPGAALAGKPTLSALVHALRSDAYAILHIICHGKLDNKKPTLYLEGSEADSEGEAVPVSASELIDRLWEIAKLPHIVFLASCESAVSAEEALGGLAQRMVSELGIPAVVAMTDLITVETAGKLAEKFYPQLLNHGFPDRALNEARLQLFEQQDNLVPALFCRINHWSLFHEELSAPLKIGEVRLGLERAATQFSHRAPVLREALERQVFARSQNHPSPPWATQFRATFSAQIQALHKSLEGSPDDEKDANAMPEWAAVRPMLEMACDRALEQSFPALARLNEIASPIDVSPFLGLKSFDYAERRFFFGRDALCDRLVKQLQKDQFLAIIGPSGSGKSSLARAGILPRLFPAASADNPAAQNAQIEAHLRYMRPGSNPLDALGKTLLPPPENIPKEKPKCSIVLIVDQFEELFTQCPDKEVRKEFVQRLMEYAERLCIILTLREDFADECEEYETLAKKIEECREALGRLTPTDTELGRIVPMDAEQLKSAIQQQANEAKLRFDEGLVDAMVDDVRGEPGAMPLLQVALEKLWERRHGRWLRLDEYQESIGGVRQAIALAADEAFSRLTEAEQTRALDIFVRLTRLDDEWG